MFKAVRQLSDPTLILLVSLFILATHNIGYFSQTLAIYKDLPNLALSLLLLVILHGGLLYLALNFFGFGRLLRWLLAATLVISAGTAYFTDTYQAIIDADMIDNSLKTDAAEIRDLLSVKQGIYLLVLGLLPAWLVLKTSTKAQSWPKRIGWRLLSVLLTLGLMAGSIFSAGDFYASYLREHTHLRYFSNPLSPLYGAIRYVDSQIIGQRQEAFKIIAPDARRLANSNSKPQLSVLVVGETARADHFGLNNYHRNTTPLLAKETLVNYTNVMACGTSTAYSVPCMFSLLERKEFTKQAAHNMENALDIINKTGVQVVWIDNNSDSTAVAGRVTYIDAKVAENNPVCEPECRDIGMLEVAAEWLQPLPVADDKLVVLHQMGSHGPAYYKRYPNDFERFTPICDSNQLDTCSREHIINTYDNTLLYTDYFLAETIAWLKTQQDNYEVSMLYISDHGESLGENGLYLHGYPYMFAPIAQIHVPMVIWAGPNNTQLDPQQLQQYQDEELSHDHLFHTLLGLFQIQTAIYQPDLDLLNIN